MDQLLNHKGSGPDGVTGEVMKRIRTVFDDLSRMNGNRQGVSNEEMLEAAASLDSIAVLEFLAAVEKEFGIELEPAVIEFEFLRDVTALAAYIDDRIRRTTGLKTDEQVGSAAANPND